VIVSGLSSNILAARESAKQPSMLFPLERSSNQTLRWEPRGPKTRATILPWSFFQKSYRKTCTRWSDFVEKRVPPPPLIWTLLPSFGSGAGPSGIWKCLKRGQACATVRAHAGGRISSPFVVRLRHPALCMF